MSTKLFVPTLEMRNRPVDRPGVLARFVDGVVREWRIRSAAQSLSDFSDAQLRDIGIGRGDIDRVVRGGR
jgi:uncharacterized protein YjiS (DUF1127 family)